MSRAKWVVGASAVASVAGVLLALLLFVPTPGCSGADRTPATAPPVILVGADGLEWRLLLRWARAGHLPNFARMLAEGASGKLATLTPTHSPAIWTTVATGKLPEKHGILDFAYTGSDGRPHLFSSLHRQSKAAWNLLSDRGLASHVLGWWCTFPVEAIEGSMVAQTCSVEQLDIRDGETIWKGGFLPGLPQQVHPEELEPAVFARSQALLDGLRAALDARFGNPDRALTPLTRKLFTGLAGAFLSDQLYGDVARERAAAAEPFTALFVYYGVTDVASHKFWRYLEPERFEDRPAAEECALFGDVILNTYRFIDAELGELFRLRPDANFVVVSDHGFHGINFRKRFPADGAEELGPFNSGDHQDAPPGVFLALGPDFARSPLPLATEPDDVRSVGDVEDVLPTLLTVLGLPCGADMDGQTIKSVLSDAVRSRSSIAPVASLEDDDWRRARAAARALAETFEEQCGPRLRTFEDARRKALRELGYTGEGLDADPQPKKPDASGGDR